MNIKGSAQRIDFVEKDVFRKLFNKRKRFMLAEEKARTVSGKEGDEADFKEDGSSDVFTEVL